MTPRRDVTCAFCGLVACAHLLTLWGGRELSRAAEVAACRVTEVVRTWSSEASSRGVTLVEPRLSASRSNREASL